MLVFPSPARSVFFSCKKIFPVVLTTPVSSIYHEERKYCYHEAGYQEDFRTFVHPATGSSYSRLHVFHSFVLPRWSRVMVTIHFQFNMI